MSLKKRKVALLLKGAISISSGVIRGAVKDTNHYVNFKIIKNSIQTYILDVNKQIADFDLFIHCWNTDLEHELCKLYNPAQSLFEKNAPLLQPYEDKYGDHALRQISQSIAIKHGIEMVENADTHYDQIIIYRPDVFLWKDMNLKNYDIDKIYVNGHRDNGGSAGDFHFVMNMKNASEFKNLLESSSQGNQPHPHRWIRNYVRTFMKKDLIMDNIVPPYNQEVLRKMQRDKSFISKYLTDNELEKMKLNSTDFY